MKFGQAVVFGLCTGVADFCFQQATGIHAWPQQAWILGFLSSLVVIMRWFD